MGVVICFVKNLLHDHKPSNGIIYKKKQKKKQDLLCFTITPGEALFFIQKGPVVQSIVSFMSLLMTNSLTVVAKVFSNTLIFFAAKM